MNADTLVAPLLKVQNIKHEYLLDKKKLIGKYEKLRAIDDVSFSLFPGECFGVVGESGCGKSTLARVILALETPLSGRVLIKGKDIHQLKGQQLTDTRKNVQMIFQDPYGSLDPRQKVQDIITEPLILTAKETGQNRLELARDTLESVGLSASDAQKYPHEFSGGQRQRISIARSIITKPALIVADEPVSALDVSVQAQILNLMMDLQEEYQQAYLFISHDLSIIQNISSKLIVMFAGQIVEQGTTSAVFKNPSHPYTQALMDAVPVAAPNRNRKNRKTGNSIQSYSMDWNSSPGCKYASRCQRVTEKCRNVKPEWIVVESRNLDEIQNQDEEMLHQVACHHPRK